MDLTEVKFIDNQAASNNNGKYIELQVDVDRVIKSWRDSVFSFEWLMSDGTIKGARELPPHEKPKRAKVEEDLMQSNPLEKPILGIGINDNIEIGSGRAEFLTLAAHGVKTIPVHIPKSNESDFKDFLADID